MSRQGTPFLWKFIPLSSRRDYENILSDNRSTFINDNRTTLNEAINDVPHGKISGLEDCLKQKLIIVWKRSVNIFIGYAPLKHG